MNILKKMKKSVKKLYKEAINNKEFEIELRTADPFNFKKPNMFSSNELKYTYVSIYYGWLVARKEYSYIKYHN